MACIKESSSIVNKKDIKADIAFVNGILMFQTEEMTEYTPLQAELNYFDGKFVTMTFKEEIKSEELPQTEVVEED